MKVSLKKKIFLVLTFIMIFIVFLLNYSGTMGLNIMKNNETRNSTKYLKPYGTYLKNRNDSCLKVDCLSINGKPNIWTGDVVAVKMIPENMVKHIQNKSKTAQDIDIGNTTLALKLTPPIIIVWAYELGYALSKGTL